MDTGVLGSNAMELETFELAAQKPSRTSWPWRSSGNGTLREELIEPSPGEARWARVRTCLVISTVLLLVAIAALAVTGRPADRERDSGASANSDDTDDWQINSFDSTLTDVGAEASTASSSAAYPSLYQRHIIFEAVQKLSKEAGNGTFYCSANFAYCGESSCTVHTVDSGDGDGSVQVGACACQFILTSHRDQAGFIANEAALSVLATPAYFDVLAGYVSNATTFDEMKASTCAMIRNKEFFPRLRPDVISYPHSSGNPIRTHTVEKVTCTDGFAATVCSNAPCFEDPTAAGPLNVTCLCPVYPWATDGSTELKLDAADMEHFGGCDAYDFETGSCAFQSQWPDSRPWFSYLLVSSNDDAFMNNGSLAYMRAFLQATSQLSVRSTSAICRDYFS